MKIKKKKMVIKIKQLNKYLKCVIIKSSKKHE